MGTRTNAKKDYELEMQSILERSKKELALLDEARYILEKQAKEIKPVLKEERDSNRCQEENEYKPLADLQEHHIKMIDTFQAENRELLKHMDILNQDVRQEFLKYVEEIGLGEVNHPHNFITVCKNCHTEIHKDSKSHVTRLRLLAKKKTESWKEKQRKMEDFLPGINEVSAELSEVKEKFNRLSIDLAAKEEIIEILSTKTESNEKIVQNLTADLDTLRRTCNVLTDAIKNYENRLAEKTNEANVFKNQLITSIQCTISEPELENTREEEGGVEDLQQEQGNAHQESINPNDKKSPEKKKSKQLAFKLKEIFKEDLSPIAEKKLRKLIPKLTKHASKNNTDFYYVHYDRGFWIINKDKILFLTTQTKDREKYTDDIGLALLYKEGTPKYKGARRVDEKWRYARMEKFKDLDGSLERAYDAGVEANNVLPNVIFVEEEGK